ncbi:hypothetical protein DR62_07275 [Burkholderia thailandensis]|nr:hypothetical protein DR62_07275 [Burkholderia thailandensis]
MTWRAEASDGAASAPASAAIGNACFIWVLLVSVRRAARAAMRRGARAVRATGFRPAPQGGAGLAIVAMAWGGSGRRARACRPHASHGSFRVDADGPPFATACGRAGAGSIDAFDG